MHEFHFMFLLAHLLLALEDFFPGHREKQVRRKLEPVGCRALVRGRAFLVTLVALEQVFECPPRTDIAEESDALALQETDNNWHSGSKQPVLEL